VNSSIAQWLIGLGATLLLALIGGVVTIGIAYGDVRARLKVSEDGDEDASTHGERIMRLETRCNFYHGERPATAAGVEQTNRHYLKGVQK
jgi:hypothetical protein